MHVDARNVHAPDPEGFEDTLNEVCDRLRGILVKEDREINAIDAALDSDEERSKLTQDIAHALKMPPSGPNHQRRPSVAW